jgi:hypothetical protein
MRITPEQCRIARGFQDIAVTDFLPQVELVANGYTSIIDKFVKTSIFDG